MMLGPNKLSQEYNPTSKLKWVATQALLYNKEPIDLYIVTFTGNSSFYKDNNAMGFNQERCYYLVFSLERIFFQSTFKYRP